MAKVYFIGLDIAKNVFQVFSADGQGKKLGNRKMHRQAALEYFTRLQPCTVGFEACGTAHYWARTLTEMGYAVKLINPQDVKKFLGNRNKTDAADAQAICEALMSPNTRFVRSKTVEQQDTDHLLARRERLVHGMTQVINQIRSFLSERGITIAQGRHQFIKHLPRIISDRWDEFSGDFQAVLTENVADYEECAAKIKKIDEIIKARADRMEECRRLTKIKGIGPLTAVALAAHVGDAKHFANGRQMSAYLGLTPREHSSGGKQRLGGITKRGNVRLRTLLILGARAAIQGIMRRTKDEDGTPAQVTSLERWILSLKEKKGIFKAAVALANKTARMAWVMLARGEEYDLSKACPAQRTA